MTKQRKPTESRKSRRSPECLGPADLERVRGSGPTWEHFDAEAPPAPAQMFDML